MTRYRNEMAVCSPVMHELRYGWLRMQDGRRKDMIGRFLQEVLGCLPVLSYDATAARLHAQLRHTRERQGMPLPFADGQIAAIAIANGLTLITRNGKDFANLPGLQTDNWFSSEAGHAR